MLNRVLAAPLFYAFGLFCWALLFATTNHPYVADAFFFVSGARFNSAILDREPV